MGQFYKVNTSRISLKEYWNLSPNWKGVLAWALKFVGCPIPDPNVFPLPSTGEHLIAQCQLPSDVLAATAASRTDLEELGFHSPTWLHIPALYGPVSMSGVSYLHSSCETVGRILHTKCVSASATAERLGLTFLTPLKDRRLFVTTNVRPTFEGTPRHMIVERQIDASAPSLHDRHRIRVAQASQSGAIRRIETVGDCMSFTDDHEKEIFETFVRRRLYVPVAHPQLIESHRKAA
jgi:hypothetical protein